MTACVMVLPSRVGGRYLVSGGHRHECNPTYTPREGKTRRGTFGRGQGRNPRDDRAPARGGRGRGGGSRGRPGSGGRGGRPGRHPGGAGGGGRGGRGGDGGGRGGRRGRWHSRGH